MQKKFFLKERMSDKKKVEFAKILYDSLQKALRELEKNFITLLAMFFSALGIYVFGFKYYIEHSAVDIEKSCIILIGATIATCIILVLLLWSCNIFAYTYRTHQIVLSLIETKFNICGIYVPKKWCNLNDSESKNLLERPDIYSLFHTFAALLIFLILVSDVLLLCYSILKANFINLIYIIYIIYILFIIIIIIRVINELFTWPTYQGKIKKLLSECLKIIKDN